MLGVNIAARLEVLAGVCVSAAAGLEDRQHGVAEVGELLGIVDKRESGSPEARLMQGDDALGDLLRGAGERETAMTGCHPVADECQEVMRKGMGVGKLEPHEIVDRVPIGMRLAGILQIILRFLLRRTANDMGKGKHIDRFAAVGRLSLQRGDLILGARQINGRREQEVGVANRKSAPFIGTGSGEDGRGSPSTFLSLK